MLLQCRTIVGELELLHKQIESYWYTRSRKCELRDGDKNTSYFHHKAKQRRKRNQIKGVEDEDGNWFTNENDVSWLIITYYRELFATSQLTEFDDVLGYVNCVVEPMMNEALDRPLSDDEIRAALFDMHPTKAPGPDGMHAVFYQKHLEIVRQNICRFVREWWVGRSESINLNSTSVVLIPKCNTPRKITEYRPISLCNVLYKIISKTLANRLNIFLNAIISENQSAFTLLGQLITDNGLIALEIFHAMKRKD